MQEPRKHTKESYLREEFWVLAVGAAFQRANIYENGTDTQKGHFRKLLFCFINLLTSQYKAKSVSDQMHIENIEQVIIEAEVTARGTDLKLKDDTFRFGTAQKLFNLYLKYLWCAGFIHEPPHFPVDRIVIQALEKDSKTNWTDLDDVEEYKRIIELARNKAKVESKSLAQWELENYGRR